MDLSLEPRLQAPGCRLIKSINVDNGTCLYTHFLIQMPACDLKHKCLDVSIGNIDTQIYGYYTYM